MACGREYWKLPAKNIGTIIGPPGMSERRLNLAQSFTLSEAVWTPIIGGASSFGH